MRMDIGHIAVSIEVNGKTYRAEQLYDARMLYAKREPENKIISLIAQTAQEALLNTTNDIIKLAIERREREQQIFIAFADAEKLKELREGKI